MATVEKSLFDVVLDDIKSKKENLESGGVNAIPFPLPALSKYVPGIMKETQYNLTAESGCSKSKMSRYFFVKTPFDYYMDNKEKKDIDVQINFFCLEDSKEVVLKKIIISVLAKQKGIRMSENQINYYFDHDKPPESLLKEIESLRPYFEVFLSKVKLIDSVRNPTGILKEVKKTLLNPSQGYLSDQFGNPIPIESLKEGVPKGMTLKYVSKITNKFTINVIDNLQNITPEKQHANKWEACDILCRDFMRNVLCNFYKCCNLIIQQQDKSSGKAQYTQTGTNIVEKLLPSTAGLAEYKNSVDSSHCFFGLFNPYKHKIEHFAASPSNYYDINQLGDYYRNLMILKSNFAETVNTSLFFDAITEEFYELPNGGDKEAMDQVYNKIFKLRKRI